MNIFDKRPLSLILCIMLGGFVLFAVMTTAFKIAVVVLGVCLIAFACFISKQLFPAKALTLICGIALLMSILFSCLYFNCYYFAGTRFGEQSNVVGLVESSETKFGRRELIIKSEIIDDEAVASYKIMLELPLEESEGVSVGTKIEFVCNLSDVSDFSEEAKEYYWARGISLYASEPESVYIVDQASPSFDFYISEYRAALCRRIILNSDENAGALLSALLLGEQSYLSGDISLDFQRVGISHVLALSGLHLTILTLLLDKILLLIRINKKARVATKLCAVIAYMAFTGFPISVVRAGLMLVISYALFLISQKSDPITTLLISVSIIVISEPYSIFDVSLWLSALSTFGILVFSEIIRQKRKKPEIKQPFSWIKRALLSIACSLTAISATLSITALIFKRISIISPISNLILLLPIEVLMCFGIALLMLGDFLWLGKICVWLGNLIINSVESISSINRIYNSAEHHIVEMLVILFTLLFFAFAVLKINKKRLALCCLLACLLSVFLSSFILGYYCKSETLFDYRVNENRETIIMQSNMQTSVIDISRPTAEGVNDNVDHLSDLNLTDVQNYIFTSYSLLLESSAMLLCGSIKTEMLYIPEPQTDEEKDIYELVSYEFRNCGTILITYNSETIISCGDFSVFPVFRSSEDNKIALTILYNDEFYTYLSSGMLEDDTKTAALKLMDGGRALILGCHGNSYYNFDFNYKIEDVEILIVSSKNLNLSSEALTHYSKSKVYYMPTEVSLIR